MKNRRKIGFVIFGIVLILFSPVSYVLFLIGTPSFFPFPYLFYYGFPLLSFVSGILIIVNHRYSLTFLFIALTVSLSFTALDFLFSVIIQTRKLKNIGLPVYSIISKTTINILKSSIVNPFFVLSVILLIAYEIFSRSRNIKSAITINQGGV